MKKGINKVINDPKIVTINIVSGGKGVLIGDFNGEKIDIDDILKFPKKSKGATQTGAIGHEIFEQWLKQVKENEIQKSTPTCDSV